MNEHKIRIVIKSCFTVQLIGSQKGINKKAFHFLKGFLSVKKVLLNFI